MTIAHPIARAWLSTGGPPARTTGAQNYDEFADDAEITAIIAANPASALAVEMPHLAPESLGTSFRDALPAAVDRLARAKADGRYARHDEIVALYRITEGDRVGYGLWTMVDTAQISTSADEPGLVIRNEDVFLEKVRERVALAQATGHLLSPVLLLQTGERRPAAPAQVPAREDGLHRALAEAVADAGTPDAVDTDQAGRTHEVWALPAGERQAALLALAGAGELVVADGNHRSLAAQTAGLRRFLAVVTTPASVAIQPYNRLVSELTLAPRELIDRLGATPLENPGVPASRGTVHLYLDGRAFALTLPPDPGAPAVDDFVAVNLARQKLPRKSTWFTPKARAGLVLAQLSAED